MRKLFIFIFLLTCIFTTLWSQKLVFEGLKEINGTQLYIKVIGSGEPLLIVHGGPGLNHQYFLPFLEPLARKYQLIFYDQRSTGASQLDVKANMNIKTFVEDMEGIRIAFGYDKINILAHSWGSIPAAAYMIAHPEHVQSMIFCNPVPLNSIDNHLINEATAARVTPIDSIERARLIASPGFQKGDVATIDSLMRLSFKSIFCDTNKMELLDMHLPENYMVSSLSLYGLANDMKRYNYLPALHNGTIPTLIIHGNCDLTPITVDTALQQDIPGAQIVVFEHSGHFPFLEENKFFIKTVNVFIKQSYK